MHQYFLTKMINMKKTVFLLLMSAACTAGFSQNLVSKKGEPFLPEKGDWSIGIDASPFLEYAGNMFSSAGNSAPTFNNYGLNQTIVGKYFATPKLAYRGIVRIGLRNQNFTRQVAQPLATPPAGSTAAPFVDDKAKRSSNFIGLGAGIEQRKGKTRLQGFYGADVFVWTTKERAKYTYGNSLTQGVAVPNIGIGNSASFAGDVVINGSSFNNFRGDGTINNVIGRVLDVETGRTIGVGLRGFIGAEYFLFPKISIGGEFGLGVGYQNTGKGEVTVESEQAVSGTETRLSTTTNFGVKSNGFIFDTDRNAANGFSYNFTPSGQIRLNLHF